MPPTNVTAAGPVLLVKSMQRYTLRLCLSMVALGALVFLVGWFWLGWGYIPANSDLLESLPVPLGAEQIRVSSHVYESDELPITPPDGWSTLATFSAPPDATREEVVDFYISRLSPTWKSCIETASIYVVVSGKMRTEMGNALFSREQAFVSVDTKNLNAASRSQTFDVYVDHDSRHRADCFQQWHR